MSDAHRLVSGLVAALALLFLPMPLTHALVHADASPDRIVSSIDNPCTGAVIPGEGIRTWRTSTTTDPAGNVETRTTTEMHFVSKKGEFRSDETDVSTMTVTADHLYSFYRDDTTWTITARDGTLNWQMRAFGDAVYYQGIVVDFQSSRSATPCP
jgi:hypothetical protein